MNNLNPSTIQCRSVAAPHISSNGKLQKVLGTILSKAKKNCPPSTPWHDLLLDDPDQEVPIKRRRQTNFDLRYEKLGLASSFVQHFLTPRHAIQPAKFRCFRY